MNIKIPINSNENKIKYGVFRLDIRTRPGWFLMQYYDNERDAHIYCDMLTTDTKMVHAVFEEDVEQ